MYTLNVKKRGEKSLKIICKRLIKKDLITLKKSSLFLRENLAIKMKQVLVNIHMYYQTNIKNPHSSVSIYNHKQPYKELLQNLPVARVTFDNHHLNDELSNTTLPLYLWSLTLPRTSVYITETDLYVIVAHLCTGCLSQMTPITHLLYLG